MNSTDSLTQIQEFDKYILYLFENLDKYCVFITSSDAHVPANRKNRKLLLLNVFGIKTDLQKAFRHSFLAIVNHSELKMEQSSENEKIVTEYEFNGHTAKIMSQGFNACPKTNAPISINIDDCEYAVNKRGLNIVVWDYEYERVVDSVSFDTFQDDDITRKTLNYDSEALCNCYKLLCELAMINRGFSNHYYNIVSKNQLDAIKIHNHLSKNGYFLAKIHELICRGIAVFAFEQTNVNEMTNPTEWEKICQTNSKNGFMKQDLNRYFEISGMSNIYSREVFEDILKNPIHSEKFGNYFRTVKQTSKYVNVDSFGQRPTESFPQEPYNTIYIFGNSIGCTWEMADCHTLTNQLQELVKERYCVVNYSVAGTGFDSAGWNMLDVEFEEGDVVMLLYHKGAYSAVKCDMDNCGVDIIDLFPYFNAHHSEEIFFDRHHPNPNGYKIIAKVMSNIILSDIGAKAPKHEIFTHRKKIPSMQEELAIWIKDISKFRPKIGSIVMNCNPFTLGHQYLIEQSAAKVDRLFVFVVEEDRSSFLFQDRMELVRKGTAHLQNVTVLSSGKYIISSTTFTDYFEKSEHQDRVVDPSMDIELFGVYIAPALGITIRFAGEEPLDNITRQYNETMAKLLPRYGVEFEEIKRKEQDGGVISASRVRRMITAGNFAGIKKLVPDTTYDFLIEKYGDGRQDDSAF